MTPTFAVVGHPNKGKSSIVSTLAHNDAIAISTRSGTTEKASAYQVKTANGGFELIDTPGFQRPNKVLAWLQQGNPSAAERAGRIARFVKDPQCATQFPDEVELLTPVVDGAAILYVVDGSRPYDSDYDAEMEILRWSGQPSMALINPIENQTHVEGWSHALAQFFKTVRVFNPMTADFDKQLALLQVFAHLQPAWSNALNGVVEDLRQQKLHNKANAALLLSGLLHELCHHQARQKVLTQDQAQVVKPLLQSQYHRWMQQREKQCIAELLALYAHYHAGVSTDDLQLPPDLFDTEQWYMWGLNKQQLALASTFAGATAGAALDTAVVGHSFMLGTIGGGLVGLGTALLGAGKLVDVKLKGLPMGGYEACYGPIKQRNFPYVVIGRFLHVYQQIHQRNHASRSKVQLHSEGFQSRIEQLETSTKKRLHRACDSLIKQKHVAELQDILLNLMDESNDAL